MRLNLKIIYGPVEQNQDSRPILSISYFPTTGKSILVPFQWDQNFHQFDAEIPKSEKAKLESDMDSNDTLTFSAVYLHKDFWSTTLVQPYLDTYLQVQPQPDLCISYLLWLFWTQIPNSEMVCSYQSLQMMPPIWIMAWMITTSP